VSAARFIVTGKIQGVFFRASTRGQAQRLGLHGHAHNLPNGCVEVIVQGDADAIDALERWLQHGPPQAQVEHVQREAVHECEGMQGFATG
jgi:acylphosphatase